MAKLTTRTKASKKSTGKMRAIKKVVDGIKFDSTMEANYYEYLKAEKAKGNVLHFELQPKYRLQDSYKKYGKTIRAIDYISDFKVTYSNNETRIIDVKGKATVDFKLKRKLFDFRYPELFLQLITWDNKTGSWVDYDEHEKAKSKARREKKAKAAKQ